MSERETVASSEPETEPEVLYHYTGLPGLINILRTGKIWASYVGLLNDRNEVDFGLQAIRETLRTSNQTPGILADLANHDMDRTFITCFTEGGDALPMWRGYAAKPGGGYAIGFRREALERAFVCDTIMSTSTSPSRVSLQRVNYDRGRLEADLKIDLARLEADPDEVPAAFKPVELFTRAAAFKDDGWKDEREWRLVVIHHLMCGIGSIGELHTHESPHGPLPHLELKLWTPPSESPDWGHRGARKPGDDVEFCIDSVWIGPEPGQRDRARGLEILMRQAGFPPHRAVMPYKVRPHEREVGEESAIHFSKWATR